MNNNPRQSNRQSSGGYVSVLALLLIFAVMAGAFAMFITSADAIRSSVSTTIDFSDKFSTGMNNLTSTALDGIYTVRKVYKIPDGAVSAPKPNPENFGSTTDPKVLEDLIRKAHRLIGSDTMLWTSDTDVFDNTPVEYYYDETILVIAWKEHIGNSVLNFAEVKIAHPSQFRKLFSDNTYGTSTKYKGSFMGKSANAVLTSNADFYKFRRMGIVVYNGEIYRTTGKDLDTCFIDANGDLLFVHANTFKTDEDIANYVKANNVVFSIAFGPILIENGQPLTDPEYFLGETELARVRAAISQLGPLHYLLIATDRQSEDGATCVSADILTFTKNLKTKNLQNVYTIDGGQTAMIMVGDRIINKVLTGSEREVSDIIYFGTALPENTEGE